jgi:hypothetical protein
VGDVQFFRRINGHQPLELQRAGSTSTSTLLAYAEIWLALMLMLKYGKRKILFHGVIYSSMYVVHLYSGGT